MSSPPKFRSPLPPEAPKESAVSRVFIAPLTFISFLVSLAIIDSRNHSLRTHEHSSTRDPPVGLYQNITYYIHSIVFTRVPSSPYSYVRSPEVTEAILPGAELKQGQQEEKWYWHTKQRHMMKAEIEDAFKVRKWVVMFLFVTGGLWILLLMMFWSWMGSVLGF